MIVRLGGPGVVHAVVVDTAFFTGNYPQACSVEACSAAGYPRRRSWRGVGPAWMEIVPRTELTGDTRHVFPVTLRRRFTHLRLNIFPDGGVARLRVARRGGARPGMLDGLTVDLAALENGADILACSDEFYSSPRNVISPGLSRVMGEGWETRRRRGPGHEWLIVRLTGHGVIRLAEIDTSGYRGNEPDPLAAGWTRPAGAGWIAGDGWRWRDLLPRTRLQPDTAHRFRVDGPPGHSRPAQHLPRRRRRPGPAVRVADRRTASPPCGNAGRRPALRDLIADMSHVVLAPDKFKGTLTAAQVAAHLAAGLARARPGIGPPRCRSRTAVTAPSTPPRRPGTGGSGRGPRPGRRAGHRRVRAAATGPPSSSPRRRAGSAGCRAATPLR